MRAWAATLRPIRPFRPAAGRGQQAAGAAILLTASPAEEWAVTAWIGSNDDSRVTLSNTLTMPVSQHTVTVEYDPCYSLDLSHQGQGAGPTADPANSPGCALSSFLAGVPITLTASPGRRLDGDRLEWNG